MITTRYNRVSETATDSASIRFETDLLLELERQMDAEEVNLYLDCRTLLRLDLPESRCHPPTPARMSSELI